MLYKLTVYAQLGQLSISSSNQFPVLLLLLLLLQALPDQSRPLSGEHTAGHGDQSSMTYLSQALQNRAQPVQLVPRILPSFRRGSGTSIAHLPLLVRDELVHCLTERSEIFRGRIGRRCRSGYGGGYGSGRDGRWRDRAG